jgi:phosphoglycolate phosphatase-like HAD superfamily hydrolase
VLIDADRSFPEAIRKTVEGEWRKRGFEVDAPGYSERHNSVLKRHGSFNDDYDIVWVLLNIMARGGGRLSEAMPTPEELEGIIGDFSGDCVKWCLESFHEEFDRGTTREMSIRAYFGDGVERGTYVLETPLLRSHWSALPLPAYVYTGRNGDEWRMAKEILSWEDFPDERIVGYDDGVLKPSPEGIAIICGRFGHERPLFFGDTASDRMSLDAFGRGWFVAIGDILRDVTPRYQSVEDALRELFGWEDDRDGQRSG